MKKKREAYLAEAREWLDECGEYELDTKLARMSLESSERAAREVDAIRAKLEKAEEEKRVAFQILDETLKSVKHAKKALDARKKSEEKQAQAPGKPNKAVKKA